jgi:hypothetical protein
MPDGEHSDGCRTPVFAKLAADRKARKARNEGAPMSDSDYIKASEREEWPSKQNGFERIESLAASHAAADDVMRELAEALRHVERTWGDRHRPEAKASLRHALAKYDRMTGGDDDA